MDRFTTETTAECNESEEEELKMLVRLMNQLADQKQTAVVQ